MSVISRLFRNVRKYVTTVLSTKYICNIYVVPLRFFDEVHLLTDCSDFVSNREAIDLFAVYFLSVRGVSL